MVRFGLSVAVLLCEFTGCAHDGLVTPAPAPEWESPFIRTSGWTGADGAATIPLPDRRTLWLFGDTWIGPVVDGRHAEGSSMVNNSIAVCAAAPSPPAPDQIRFFWGDTAGKPAAWAVPVQEGEWFWPAGGGVVVPGPGGGDRLLLFMTRISRIDKGDSIWNFRARGSTLLSISNPAEDPTRWRLVQTTLNTLGEKGGEKGSGITWGAAAVLGTGRSSKHLLVYGIDATSNLNKKLVLALAPIDTVERFETWNFRSASGWSEHQSDAVPVVENVASELSVHRVQTDRWVMVYSEPPMGAGILVRTAGSPFGPWSEPVHVYTCPEPAMDKKLFVYAAKGHPELSNALPSGELLVSYCVNSTDFWDVAAHADKYRPRFVRIRLP